MKAADTLIVDSHETPPAWVVPRFKLEPRATDTCEVECPECGTWSALALWTRTSVECETCGDHNAMECPACLEDFSSICVAPLRTREPGNSSA